MEVFTCKKGTGAYVIFFSLIAVDILIFLLTTFIDVYVVLSLIWVFLIALNIYGIYYFLLSLTLKFTVDSKGLNITGIWGIKKVHLSFRNIEGYKVSRDPISGIRLFGVGNNNFALGRYVIDKIGTTRLFVTCRENSIYLKTKDMNYAISPNEMERFTQVLENHDVSTIQWKNSVSRGIRLHKDKKFMATFIGVSVIIFLITIIPLILYVKNLIPNQMPLTFNANFQPAKIGTAKQYAFKQTIYGVLNMALLFCMYYAAHFHAKYDKKSARIYIYVSFVVSIMFLLMQLRTVFQYIV